MAVPVELSFLRVHSNNLNSTQLNSTQLNQAKMFRTGWKRPYQLSWVQFSWVFRVFIATNSTQLNQLSWVELSWVCRYEQGFKGLKDKVLVLKKTLLWKTSFPKEANFQNLSGKCIWKNLRNLEKKILRRIHAFSKLLHLTIKAHIASYLWWKM